MCTEFMKCVDSALFGSVFDLRRANKAVRAKTEECKVEHFKDDDRLKHPENHLNEYLTASIETLHELSTHLLIPLANGHGSSMRLDFPLTRPLRVPFRERYQ